MMQLLIRISSRSGLAGYIKIIIRSVFSNLRMIYSNRAVLNSKLRWVRCEILVLSVLWCGVRSMSNNADQSTLAEGTKFLCSFNMKMYQLIYHNVKKLRCLFLEQKRFLYSSCTYSKMIQKSTTVPLKKISYRTYVHNINIRRKDVVTIPQYRTSLYQRSYPYTVCKVLIVCDRR